MVKKKKKEEEEEEEEAARFTDGIQHTVATSLQLTGKAHTIHCDTALSMSQYIFIHVVTTNRTYNTKLILKVITLFL